MGKFTPLFQRFFLAVGFFVLVNQTAVAQVATTYSYGSGTGFTLDPMTGSTTLTAASSDDGASTLTNIGFNFVFNGVTYTQFGTSVNGFLRLGAVTTATSTYWTNSAANAGTGSPAIMPYWDDLHTGSTAGGGKVHYVLLNSGAFAAPNQRLVVEWFVTVPRNTTGAANGRFQCWLDQGTNKITFVYGAIGTNTGGSATMGIASSSTDFQTASAIGTINTSSFQTTFTTAIGSGTYQTFTPIAPCSSAPAAPTALNFTNPSNTQIAGSFTPNVTPPTGGYLVIKSTSSSITPAAPVDGTTYTTASTTWGTGNVVYVGTASTFTASTLVSNTQYYFWVFPYNAQAGTCTPKYGAALTGNTYTCAPTMTAPTAGSFSQTSATISWTAPVTGNGTITGYYLQYRQTGSGTWLNANGGSPITGTSFVLNNILTASTTYEYQISAINTVCQGPWTAGVNFTTSCSNFTLNVTQGFNAATIPACWSTAIVVVQTGTKISFPATGSNPTTSPQEGTNMIQYNSFSSTSGSAGSEERLVSPPITTTGTASVDVEFQWRNENSTSYNSGAYLNEGVQVQYSLDGTTWVNAGSFFPRYDASLASGTAAWKLKTVTLPGAAGNQATLYVGFKFHSEWGNNCFMDAVVIKPSPSCVAPTSSAATNVTATSFDYNFICSGCSGNYIVEYGATGFTPGTGATAGAGGTVVNTSSTTGTINTGVSPSTSYQYYVRQVCTGPTYSANSSVQAFTTLCGALTVPWSEGFEGLSSVSSTIFPNCWLEGTGTDWRSQDASTTTYNDPRTGSKYVGCLYGGTNDRLWTPGFQLTAGTSYDFSTWFVGDGYASWVGDIVWNTSQSAAGETVLGSSFIAASTTSTSGTNYSQILRQFIPSSTGVYYFGIRVSSSFAPFSSLSFDDFSLTLTPACAGAVGGAIAANPTCVGAPGTTVSFTSTGISAGPGSGYQWQSSTDNFSSNVVDIPSATSTTYTTPAINASGTTYYRLKVTCTSGTAIAYSNIVTLVSSVPVYASMPYQTSFENAWLSGCSTNDRPDASWSNINTTGNVNASWRRDDDGASAGWTNPASYMYSPAGSDGSRSARFHSGYTTAALQSWMDLYIDLSTAIGTKQLTFDVNDVSGSDALDVLLSTDGGLTFPTTLLSAYNPNLATWQSQSLSVASNSATAVIRFRATADFGSTDIGLDNVKVVPPCSGIPSAGTNPADPSICTGQTSVLTVATPTSGPGISYAWEEFNGSWGPAIGTVNATTYTTPTLSSTKQYRIAVTCSNSSQTTIGNPITVNVVSPTVTGLVLSPVTGACGASPVTATATVSAGASALWFATNTSNVVLATGNTYTTTVSGATTVYASAVQPMAAAYTTGRLSGSASSPTTNSVTGNYGLGPCFTATQPFILNSVSVWVGTSATFAVELFDVLGSTVVAKSQDFVALPANAFSTIQLNFRIPTAGSYRLRLAAPTTGAGGQLNREGTQTFPISLGQVGQITGSYGGASCGTNYHYFYDWNISPYTCESARSSIAIPYSSPASITVNPNTATLCPGAAAIAFTVKDGVGGTAPANYDYTWTGTGLFNDAPASSSYTGAIATTVYGKPAAGATPYTYTVTGTGTGPNVGCVTTASTTLTVPVFPAAGTVTTTPALSTFCGSGTAALSLSSSPVLPAQATYIWQSSSNIGGPYTGSLGTAATYTTPSVSSPTFYRCQISCLGNVVDASVPAEIQVNNPAVSSPTVTGGTVSGPTTTTICGAQSVTLSATPSGGATAISWYDAPSGGNLLQANSNTYLTPNNVTTNKLYYAEASLSGSAESAGRPSTAVTSGYLGTNTGLVFSTTSALTIQSATMYVVGTGTVTIAIQDGSGVEVASTSAISVVGGASPVALSVPINLTVPGAVASYRLVVKAYTGITDLMRESAIGGSRIPHHQVNFLLQMVTF